MNILKPQLLKVTEDKRFLIKEDGTPFFWLGDTAWELFHKLNREEAVEYLQNRAENGFNVIQAVALAELDGLVTGNAYGRRPLLKNSNGEFDPTLPDTIVEGDSVYTYWDHVDYIVDRAAEMGLYIGFLPTWGDKYNLAWGKGPVVFNRDNAKVYGKWLGERYKDRTNIIWILGGDRSLDTSLHFDVVNGMAEGIKESDEGRHLMTFHPMGGGSSSKHVHNENWLDFNMMQSGHGALNIDNYAMIGKDYGLSPIKPTLDGEPRYEDHPINFNPQNGYFDDFDVRQAAYWAVFAGAFGHTYGHHSIWCMCTEPADYFIMHWRDALNQPGALQMKHMKALVEARPFLDSVPDQSLLDQNYLGANHIQALRGKDFAFLYSPNGLKMKVAMSKISGEKVKAYWYDPRSGATTFIGVYENSGVVEFTPPSSGRRKDWVLVLDDESKNYSAPNQI
jgi:hypothetical protein